ncbi:MAG: hypothetical protein J6A15_10135 [Clostridia bacterium]|nr:hypothetical protein [Clostridia bacterium]
MQYKKVITSSILVAFVVAIVNELVFAAENVVTQDVILDGVLNILVLIQKYSWPFVTLLMIYALYKYYVIGSEVLADKIKGQQMVVGISVFMVLLQCAPLVYAFFIV